MTIIVNICEWGRPPTCVRGISLVYEVAGWPMQDLWREPRLIMRAGEAPCQGG